MAILPLTRISLFGQAVYKERVLAELQEMGCLHLVSPALVGTGRDLLSSRLHEVYQYLRQCPEKRRQAHDAGELDLPAVEQETLEIKEQARILSDERDYLLRRIRSLEPWGDFIFPDPATMGGYRFWFYIIPHNDLRRIPENAPAWECVYRDSRFSYVVAIAREEPRDMPVARTHTGDRSLSWLTGRLNSVETALDELHWRRVGLTRWCNLLARVLAAADDREELRRTIEETYDDGRLFFIEAWAPVRELDRLRELSRRRHLLISSRPPEPEEKPPTLLENPPAYQGGEEILKFYTVPGYHVWDPSMALFFSFTVFFAMILSDAGYGLMLLLVWLLFRGRLARKSTGLYHQFTLLTAGTLIYGVLIGSYFGVTPGPEDITARLQILDIQDRDRMMMVSILTGIGHLMIAHGINFLQASSRSQRLPPLGWLAILAGGLLLWLETIDLMAGSMVRLAGYLLLAGGAGLVFLFSSNRPWRQAGTKQRLLRVFDGMLALTGLTRAFGDVLSYLRLFALGLASAQLAATFNQLAADAMHNIAGLGMLAAILILIFGHGLNFLLAVVSGVVHGLRLNFIEFFNWGLTEEGYSFVPFRKRVAKAWTQSS